MTARNNILEEISRCLSIWSSDLAQGSKGSRYNDHTLSEDIAAGLLNRIFGYHLTNANRIRRNFEFIDLVDPAAEDRSGVAVQVSATNSRPKALHTIDGFCTGDFGKRLCDQYTTLIILILTTETKFKNWEKLKSDECTVSIMNLTDLSEHLRYLDTDQLEQILEYLCRELLIDTAKDQDPRTCISRFAHILDAEAIDSAAEKMTEDDTDKFYMVDPGFSRMLRVVSNGCDVPHEAIDRRLMELCRCGSPAILTGYSGTGKSTIILRTAVSWVRSGGIALWLPAHENLSLDDTQAIEFFHAIDRLIPADGRVLLCLDNPSLWSSALSLLRKHWPNDPRLHLLLAERPNRLSRITDASSDRLHHWFDGATVVAMMQKDPDKPFRIKDYPIEFIPESNLRKQEILEKSVAVMFRRGVIQQVCEADAVQQIMRDYNKSRVSLMELIYRAQFWLKDYASKPEQLRMDWDEWQQILYDELNCEDDAVELYGIVALCHCLGIPISVSLFCSFFGFRARSLTTAIKKMADRPKRGTGYFPGGRGAAPAQARCYCGAVLPVQP